MLVILPASNIMDMSPSKCKELPSIPRFQNMAEEITSRLRVLTVNELGAAMDATEEEAKQVWDDLQHFDDKETPVKPALFAFNDTLFQSMSPQFFSPADVHYAQRHISIISPVYGLLNPLDIIKKCGFDYSIKVPGLAAVNLFEFWKDVVTHQIITDAEAAGGNVLCLAPECMLPAINVDAVRVSYPMITVCFRVRKDGEYILEPHTDLIARGALAERVMKNKLEKLDAVKEWSWKGFKFSQELSDDKVWYFIKDSE